MSVPSLNVGQTLNQLLALKDEKEVNAFIGQLYKSLSTPESIETLKSSATKADLTRVAEMLQDPKASIAKRCLAGFILASIGDESHEKVLEKELFQNEAREVHDDIFWTLLSTASKYPIAPRLKMIFESWDEGMKREKNYLTAVEKEIKKNGLTPELMQQLDYESYNWESQKDRFDEDVTFRLRELSLINDYKMEFGKYRDRFNELLSGNLTSGFSMTNLNYDVAVNAAMILDAISLRVDVVEKIRPLLQRNTRCVYLAGIFGEPDLAKVLASELKAEEEYSKDPYFWVSYRDALIEALSEMGSRFKGKKEFEAQLEDAMEQLTKMLCKNIDDELLSLKLLRAIENIQGEKKTAEYVVDKIMEAPDIHQCGYLDILVLIKEKERAYEKLEGIFYKGKLDERRKAEEAIGKMGLSQAVDLLVTKQLTGLYSEYIAKPIQQVEDESLQILKRTVTQVEKTYTVNTRMSEVVFGVGIFIIAFGAVLALTGTSDPNQLWIGSGSIIAGILTTMVGFAKGPISIVQSALADLAQVETAFLYNVRSTGLASFAFLKEYMQKDEPDINVLETCTAKMRECAKNTLLLIELYGGGNDAIKDYMKEKKDEFVKEAVSSPQNNTPAPNQNTPKNPP